MSNSQSKKENEFDISTPIDREWNIAFSQNPEKAGWLLERLQTEIVPRLDVSKPLRILDLGCGCGDESFLLAQLFPRAEIVGLDISEPNIAHARQELEQRRLHAVSFVCGDYASIDFPRESFDLIVADGVLHLIPGCREQVIPKLSRELAPGGLLTYTLPGVSVFNGLLWLARSTLKTLRSAATDRLVLEVAKALHGSKTSESRLRERVHYMYLTPQLWASHRLQSQFCNKQGLALVADQPYPHASVGQFQHRFCIYTKPIACEPAACRAA